MSNKVLLVAFVSSCTCLQELVDEDISSLRDMGGYRRIQWHTCLGRFRSESMLSADFYVGKYVSNPALGAGTNMLTVNKKFGLPAELMEANCTIEISSLSDDANSDSAMFRFYKYVPVSGNLISFDAYFQFGLCTTTTFQGKRVEFIVDRKRNRAFTIDYLMKGFGFGYQTYIFDRGGLHVLYDLPDGIKGRAEYRKIE